MELHQEIGPLRTSISAIAERAGVERLTVYRHFPDDDALFAGCSGVHAELHPLPEPAVWRGTAEPAERTRLGLGALYGYYARTRSMQSNLERDVDHVAALARILKPFSDYLAHLAEDLASAWHSGDPMTLAVARHATRFATWHSLDREGVSDAAKVTLVTRWLGSVSREPAISLEPGRV